jgi:hypothetical protein
MNGLIPQQNLANFNILGAMASLVNPPPVSPPASPITGTRDTDIFLNNSSGTNPSYSLASAINRQDNAFKDMEQISSAITLKKSLAESLEGINKLRTQQNLPTFNSFTELVNDPEYADSIKQYAASMSMTPEGLVQIASLDETKANMAILKKKELLAWELLRESTARSLITANLQSMKEANSLASSGNS